MKRSAMYEINYFCKGFGFQLSVKILTIFQLADIMILCQNFKPIIDGLGQGYNGG